MAVAIVLQYQIWRRGTCLTRVSGMLPLGEPPANYKRKYMKLSTTWMEGSERGLSAQHEYSVLSTTFTLTSKPALPGTEHEQAGGICR